MSKFIIEIIEEKPDGGLPRTVRDKFRVDGVSFLPDRLSLRVYAKEDRIKVSGTLAEYPIPFAVSGDEVKVYPQHATGYTFNVLA